MVSSGALIPSYLCPPCTLPSLQVTYVIFGAYGLAGFFVLFVIYCVVWPGERERIRQNQIDAERRREEKRESGSVEGDRESPGRRSDRGEGMEGLYWPGQPSHTVLIEREGPPTPSTPRKSGLYCNHAPPSLGAAPLYVFSARQ